VHINRTLRELREHNLVVLKRRTLTILDVAGLRAYCGFNANYLHLKNSRWKGRRGIPWIARSGEG
jgi:hypothetical protein